MDMNDLLSGAVNAHGGLSRWRSTDPLAGAQIEKEQNDDIQTEHSTYHVGATAPRNVKNIVLIHGGFVDGSGWEGVYNTLKKKGYNITIVQNPTISLAADVAVTKRVIAAQNGPVILVGHSYGGVVITEAGTDPKVVGLVYVAAFAPDRASQWKR
jgi:pimeloyl-ACP methyl ester carboxylesterase